MRKHNKSLQSNSKNINPEKVKSPGVVAFSGRNDYQIIHKQETHIGPVPSPNTIREYNEIYPNAAEIIFHMAKSQHEHKMNTDHKTIDNDYKLKSRGQWFAFIICIMAIISATILIYFGCTITGSIFAGVPFVIIIKSFLNKEPEKQKAPEKV